MLRELGVSVTHPVSHAKPAWGKAPLNPALGLPCPIVWGSVLFSVPSDSIWQVQAGTSLCPLRPVWLFPSTAGPAWRAVLQDAAGSSLLTRFFPCICLSHALEVLEKDTSPAVCCQPLRRGPHGEV